MRDFSDDERSQEEHWDRMERHDDRLEQRRYAPAPIPPTHYICACGRAWSYATTCICGRAIPN